MDTSLLPTKSNLIKLQGSLKVTKQGYDLLERKRLILTHELEKYVSKTKEIKDELAQMIGDGKNLVREVNTDIGVDNFTNISNGVKIDNYIDIKNLTFMGVEIPSVVHKPEIVKRNFGFYNTTHVVDETILKFNAIQEKLIEFAIISNTVYRLQKEIGRVRSRANALKNIVIPENEKNLKQINEVIEEREREEFVRLKVLKKNIL